MKNATRLFVLGVLERGGPMHGHQIRRAAQVDRIDLWAEVKPGSLYGALHRMAADGAVEEVRTEREGNLPQRTVYAITESGRQELAELRHALLRDTRLRPDPVDLAMQFTDDLSFDELHALVEDRREALATELGSWRRLREQAAPYLTGLEQMGFEHILMRLETEVAWHDRLLKKLPALLPQRDADSGKE